MEKGKLDKNLNIEENSFVTISFKNDKTKKKLLNNTDFIGAVSKMVQLASNVGVEQQVILPSWYVEPLDKKHIHHGCLNCGGTEHTLDLETRLYNEFGGWRITKDDEMYFEEEMNKGDTKDGWNKIKQLKEIEKEAQEDPNHDWRAVFYLALRGGTYQRHDINKWVLIESNKGFA